MGVYRCFIFLILLCIPCSGYALDKVRLDRVMEGYKTENGPCTAIILDATTGHIEYVYNREMAFGRCYPPGSIAKTWTALVLLTYPDEFAFNPAACIECPGGYYPGNKTAIIQGDRLIFNLVPDGGIHFPCSARAGHGQVDLRSALVLSCNTYFLTVASHDPEMIYRKLISFWHLDERTGLISRDVQEAYPLISRPSSGFQYMAATIGEGGTIQVTPLKVAQTYGAVFEGQLLRPFSDNADGINPAMQYPLPLSRSSLAVIRSALGTNIESGTLKGLNNDGNRVRILAGKTGTASHYRKKFKNHGWTVLHLSTGNRRYVMTVFVLNGTGPKHGKKLAGELCNAL